LYLVEDTLDDLLRAVYTAILADGEDVTPSKGATKELFGVVLELRNPLCRLSLSEMKGRIYSALGELVWYLAGAEEHDFIAYYLKKGYEPEPGSNVVWGAYGPRLFRMRGAINQIANIQKLLTEKPSSRRAVIQLFNAEDIQDDHEDVPCTCTLQFAIRRTGLDLFVSMRSNDAYFGLPHDKFGSHQAPRVQRRQ
jgi:thymidylate synthase